MAEKHQVFWRSSGFPRVAWTPLRFTRDEFREKFWVYAQLPVSIPEFTATASTWRALGFPVPRSNLLMIKVRGHRALLQKRSPEALKRLPRP